jgi:hypothetical protein
LEHAEARAEEVIAAVGEVDGPAHSNEVQSKEVGRRNERFMQLLDISPSAAVVDAWIDIEELLRDASSTGNPSSKIVSTIQLTEKLPPHLKRLIVELRHIRNTVAHADAEISRSAASRFGDLAEIAMVQLQLMTTKKEG